LFRRFVESAAAGPPKTSENAAIRTARRLQFRLPMIALMLYLLSLTPTTAPCEQIGPRLDGTYVTVCQGTVVAVRDSLGNSRERDPTTGTITVRAPGAPPMVLEAAPSVITFIP
jgi:hypothetical protein